YQKWLAEDGNAPDPEFTQEELDAIALKEQITDLKTQLRSHDIWLFRFILELFQIGKDKGLWVNADASPDLLAKGAAWKQKLDDLDLLEP
ncbi:unnamed protein product, partial [marine sediment metagenome]